MAGRESLAAIVLAAGLGTRMKSQTPKVLHRIAFKPMLFWPVSAALSIKADPVVLVLGHGKDQVISEMHDAFGKKAEQFRIAHQKQQKGTADAVKIGLRQLKDYDGAYTLILYGDVPLLTKDTLQLLLRTARKKISAIAMLTTFVENPAGYGRVVRETVGRVDMVQEIVEDKDAKGAVKAINEINAGIYLVETTFLRSVLRSIKTDNAQNEFYLTDMVSIARKKDLSVLPVVVDNHEEVSGVNDRAQLSELDFLMRMRINLKFAQNGVTFIDPATTLVSPEADIQPDVTLYPGVEIRGACRIAGGTVIESGCIIEDSSIAANAHIKPYSVIEESTVGENTTVGPFAHLRPGAVMHTGSKVGNFVELKKTELGPGSKANHLTYLGDTVIGKGVNVGAGTITCNYDGAKKSVTTIEDGAFIGSDTQLVAPVTVGKNATIAAGTTVYEDVPDGALSLTRPKQVNIKGYYKAKKLPRLIAAGKIKAPRRRRKK